MNVILTENMIRKAIAMFLEAQGIAYDKEQFEDLTFTVYDENGDSIEEAVWLVAKCALVVKEI